MDDNDNADKPGLPASMRSLASALPSSLKGLSGQVLDEPLLATGSKPLDPDLAAWCATRAAIMFAGWRDDEAFDPIFLDLVIRELAKYPREVVIKVTEELPAQQPMSPKAVSVVRAALEAAMAPIRAREQRERALAETLARRKDSLALEENRLSRPTLDQLREQHPQLLGRDKERVKLQEAFEQANRELHRRVETALRHSRVKMDIEARRQRSNEHVDAREQQPAHRRILGS